VSGQSSSFEDLYADLPNLNAGELKATIVELNALRRSVRAGGGDEGIVQSAVCDFLLGDAHARLGRTADAFRLWEAAVESNYAALEVMFAGSDLVGLVNERRFLFPREANPAPKPRTLLFGAFDKACAAWAETVHAVASSEIHKARWDASRPLIHYNPRTCDLSDILECLPNGWRPELILASVFEAYPLPLGIESTTIPRVGWAGDLIHNFDAVRECCHLFDMLVVDQARDVEFARRAGHTNVIHVSVQSLLDTSAYLHPVKPHHDRPIDVAFLGLLDEFPTYTYRREILSRLTRLRADYNIVIRENIEDLATAYRTLGDARIGLNVNAEFVGRWAKHSYRHACPRRVYEVMSTGALCMTPTSTAGVDEEFDVGADVVCFTPDNFEDELIRRLEDREGSETIAMAGRSRALAEHAISHRMRDVLAAAIGLRAQGGGVHASGVARQQYLVGGLASKLWPSVSSVRMAPIPPNVRGCLVPPNGDPEVALQLFEEAARDKPDNVNYGLNALSCLVEMEDWFEARQLAETLVTAADKGLAPASVEGWLRRPVHLGRVETPSWWRSDLRLEMANAYYVDPERGDAFAHYLGSHLRVAFRDYVGCCASLAGDGHAAAEAWQEAYDLDARDEYVTSRLAELRATQADYDDALVWAERARVTRPFNARNTIITALCHERLGADERAAELFTSLEYRNLRSREEALAWYVADSGLFPPITT
jgi:tetratricopeptide (TPR) repeat protein